MTPSLQIALSESLLPREAIEYMMANSEIHFDSAILEAFLKSVAAYPRVLL
jgi:HD-GYP domain-containing protein (c-di-GMP phosphodiesterase class II)